VIKHTENMAKNSMSSSHRLDKRERERERERKALEIKKKKLMQFSQCDQTDPDKLQALKNRKMERVSSNVGVKHESAKKKKEKKKKRRQNSHVTMSVTEISCVVWIGR
jgi:hypothetical protein